MYREAAGAHNVLDQGVVGACVLGGLWVPALERSVVKGIVTTEDELLVIACELQADAAATTGVKHWPALR